MTPEPPVTLPGQHCVEAGEIEKLKERLEYVEGLLFAMFEQMHVQVIEAASVKSRWDRAEISEMWRLYALRKRTSK